MEVTVLPSSQVNSPVVEVTSVPLIVAVRLTIVGAV